MSMRLDDGEPEAGPWRVEPVAALLARLLPAAAPAPRRARILAVDGRSAGGKSTFAERVAATVPGTTVVHTDDVAWNQAIMDWASLLAGGVLEPLHRGEPVRFRPPAWEAHERAGAIEVPASSGLVVVEGVGSGRAELARYYDAIVWVQSDAATARARGIERDEELGGHADVPAFWEHWESEEAPHFARDRPWTRADAIVSGTPAIEHDARTEVVVAQENVTSG